MKSKKPFLISCLLAVVTILSIFTYSTTPKTLAHSLDGLVQKQDGQSGLDSFLSPNIPDAYPVHPGFPIYYDKWTERASVTIADIQNDGSRELLLPTYDGYIYAWSATGQVLPSFPLSVPGWRIRGRLALGDLNHDGALEIAAGLESASNGVGSRIAIWQPDGTPLPGWPKDTLCARPDQSCTVAGIILADLNKDSNLEVIAATNNRDLTSSDPSKYVPNLYVWQSNGSLAPGSWPNDDDHNVAIIAQMAVGDLDGDTYPDIVTGRDYNRLFAFNRLGANLSGWPHYVWYPYDANDWTDDQIEFPRSSPALADLDQDGDLEYIIPGHRRHAQAATYFATDLLIYNANATRFTGWELPASGSSFVAANTTRMIEAPAIGDLTGDSRPEIVLATQDGYVRAYTAQKQVLWAFNYALGREVHASETVIGDVDGDGWNEVVFGTFWVNLITKGQVGIYILDHNGIPKANTPILLNSVGISNSPALGDLDSDGFIEIAAATYDGSVYVWNASGQALPGRLPWPMPRHDLQRTGRYIDPRPDFSSSFKVSSNYAPKPGESLTFTIKLIQSRTPANETIQLSDIIPPGLSYVPHSLAATSGVSDDSQAPTLRWNGIMFETAQVTITYRVTVNQGANGAITNTAQVNAGSAGPFTRSAMVIVNAKKIFLPIVWR